MSGLVAFFQEALTADHNNRHGISAPITTAREEDGAVVAYETSTVTLVAADAAPTDASSNTNEPQPTTTTPCVKSLMVGENCETGKLSFQDWSTFHKEWIVSFMSHRLFDEVVGNSSSPNHQQEEEEQDNSSSWNRKKRSIDTSFGRHAAVAPRRTRITTTATSSTTTFPPHIRKTLHTARHFGDLNLSTKHVELGRLTIDKIWPFRSTRRPSVVSVLPNNQVIYASQPEFIRMSLHPCIDDGPLDMVYGSVLSVEVTMQQQQQQQHKQPAQSPIGDHKKKNNGSGASLAVPVTAPSETQQLRLMAQAAMSELDSSPQVKRLCIFFYNHYAKALDSILPLYRSNNNNKNQSYSLQLQLYNVPPASIIPNGAGLSDWFNRYDASPYCLCLGDHSLMRVVRQGGSSPSSSCNANHASSNSIHYRFDGGNTDPTIGSHLVDRNEDSLRVRVLLVSNQTQHVVREWELSSRHPNFIAEVGTNNNNRSNTHGEHKSMIPEPAPIPTRTTTTNTNSTAVQQQQPFHNPPGGASLRPPARPATTTVDALLSIPTIAGKLGNQAVIQDPLQQQQRHHHYRCLGDLDEHLESHQAMDPASRSCFVDVFGVALGFSAPCQTKRGEWMRSIALVDDSFAPATSTTGSPHQPGAPPPVVPAVALNAFAKDKAALPDVKYCGDVIRIHRTRVQKWKGDIQLMGSRGTSYVVFRKQPSEETVDGTNNNTSDNKQDWVVRSPSKKCSVAAHDEARFPQLWDWGQARLYTQPTIKPDRVWTLADVQRISSELQRDVLDEHTEEGDLTVMITAILKCSPQPTGIISPFCFLRIWDGTGPPLSEPYPAALSGQTTGREGDPPPAALERLADVVAELRRRNSHSNLDTPQAVTGRVANVAVWELSHWELLVDTIQPGSFVRMRNVRIGVIPGGGGDAESAPRVLMASAKTHLTPLPNLTFEVVRLIEEHDKRLKRKDPVLPGSGVLPLAVQPENANPSSGRSDDPAQTAAGASLPSLDRLEGSEATASLKDLVSSHCGQVLFNGFVRIVDTIPSIKDTSESALEQTFRLQRVLGLRVLGMDSTSINVLVVLNSCSANVLLRSLHERVPSRDQDGGTVSRLWSAIQEKQTWNATIVSVVHQGSRYFELDKLGCSIVF